MKLLLRWWVSTTSRWWPTTPAVLSTPASATPALVWRWVLVMRRATRRCVIEARDVMTLATTASIATDMLLRCAVRGGVGRCPAVLRLTRIELSVVR